MNRPEIKAGDVVFYSGFHGDLVGTVTEVVGYADGSVFEYEVLLENGKTAFAKPTQVQPETASVQRVECSTCSGYGRPGWIVNAHQWMRCPACNPQEVTS